MRKLVQVRDLETACPHHRFCLGDSDWRKRSPCIVDKGYVTCPMYKDIESGGSPWNWRISPHPGSEWWDDNTDEITYRLPTSLKEQRPIETEEKSTKVYGM